ncbi:hypothetical protein MMYC01_204387 [Madurella mycetomatis]|uniref:Uncharacterized protein n=1 Tax=Madurella mycetomatis TaxID=100816 RepID=A0A175WA02_9PEZI|nr:hypothetical protein MMYC01_204387 [Madurella mycetomatis]
MPSTAEETRIKAALEAGSVKFHIKAGNAKWQCTLLDRATHERKKAVRTDSSSSVSSTDSATSTTSSTTSSH